MVVSPGFEAILSRYTPLSPKELTQGKEAMLKKPPQQVERVYDRSSLHRRLFPGKEGTRRRRRYENDRFIGHPFATLSAADLLPPGYPANTPSFHFLPDYANIFASDPSAPPSPSFYDKSANARVKSLPRGLKRSWKNCSPSFKDWMKQIDVVINQWLNEYSQGCTMMEEEEFDLLNVEDDSLESEEGEDNWTLVRKHKILTSPPSVNIVEKDDTQLVCYLTQPVFRAFVHQACRYYGLQSCSRNSSDGRRLTYIYKWNTILGKKLKNPLSEYLFDQ